jgi:hypothetical protein
MKKKNASKKLKSKPAGRKLRPAADALAPAASPPSGKPPLAGEELERKVADVLCVRFRETPERIALRKECQGAEHTAIEAAVVSPRVQSIVEPVAQASALEHAIAVLQLLFSSAKAALECEKPTPAQIIALKILIGVLAEKMMQRIEGRVWKESTGVLFFSDFERSVVENVVQLMRRTRAPVPEDTAGASEISTSADGRSSDGPLGIGE